MQQHFILFSNRSEEAKNFEQIISFRATNPLSVFLIPLIIKIAKIECVKWSFCGITCAGG